MICLISQYNEAFRVRPFVVLTVRFLLQTELLSLSQTAPLTRNLVSFVFLTSCCCLAVCKLYSVTEIHHLAFTFNYLSIQDISAQGIVAAHTHKKMTKMALKQQQGVKKLHCISPIYMCMSSPHASVWAFWADTLP